MTSPNYGGLYIFSLYTNGRNNNALKTQRAKQCTKKIINKSYMRDEQEEKGGLVWHPGKIIRHDCHMQLTKYNVHNATIHLLALFVWMAPKEKQ